MKRIAAVAFAALALAARADEKTYDLQKLSEDRAQAGQKARFEKTDTMKNDMQILVAGEVVQEEQKKETKEFVFEGEVLAAENGKATKSKATFEKARTQENDEEKVWGFEGKTVIATREKDGGWSYLYEDESEVAEEDVAALKDALDQKKKKDANEGLDAWLPKDPVKVGDVWEPSIEKIVEEFEDEGDEDKLGYDLEKSSASFTLKSVEKKDGVEFATIAGEIKVMVNSLGGQAIDDAIPMKMEFEFTGALDQSSPEGSGTIRIKFKGDTTIQGPNGQEVELKFDVSGKMKSKATPVK